MHCHAIDKTNERLVSQEIQIAQQKNTQSRRHSKYIFAPYLQRLVLPVALAAVHSLQCRISVLTDRMEDVEESSQIQNCGQLTVIGFPSVSRSEI